MKKAYVDAIAAHLIEHNHEYHPDKYRQCVELVMGAEAGGIRVPIRLEGGTVLFETVNREGYHGLLLQAMIDRSDATINERRILIKGNVPDSVYLAHRERADRNNLKVGAIIDFFPINGCDVHAVRRINGDATGTAYHFFGKDPIAWSDLKNRLEGVSSQQDDFLTIESDQPWGRI
jgi:hypothetical protein